MTDTVTIDRETYQILRHAYTALRDHIRTENGLYEVRILDAQQLENLPE